MATADHTPRPEVVPERPSSTPEARRPEKVSAAVDTFPHARRACRRGHELAMEWDRLPLSVRDEADYLVVILPAVIAQVQEYLEQRGAALVVRV